MYLCMHLLCRISTFVVNAWQHSSTERTHFNASTAAYHLAITAVISLSRYFALAFMFFVHYPILFDYIVNCRECSVNASAQICT